MIGGGTRTARVKGKNIRVPAETSYARWRKSLEPLLADKNLDKIRAVAAKSGNVLTAGIGQALNAKTVQEIAEIVRRAPENVRVVWNLAHEDIKILDSNFKGGARYFPAEKGIRLDISEDATAFDQKPYRKILHESAHLIDHRMENYSGYRSVNFKDEIFARTLINEAAARVKALLIAKDFEAVCEQISAELASLPLAEQHEVSDIWYGVSNGEIYGHYGHPGDYWTRDGGANVAREAFAHMLTASAQNPAAVKHIRKYFPRSFELFEEIVTDYVKGEEQL